jgi:transposase
VEPIFRDTKTPLETRPVFHRRNETIRGHVICSFLALLRRKELDRRQEAAGERFEWAQITQDRDALQIVTIQEDGKRFASRSQCQGACGKLFKAAGVALPPTIREV